MTDANTAGAPRRMRRVLGITAGTVLLSATTFVGTAAGQEAIGCGDVITEDTTLTSDIGPCPGGGLTVEADGVTLDLGGHTITGNPNARRAPDKAGILLYRVSGVTVTNGTVENFDGGVVVRGGSDNTVRKVTARDNVNYRVVTGRDSRLADIDPEQGPFCNYGDGIALFNSSDSVVEHNEVIGNGPYGGISLIGNSDDNLVAKNKILDNDVLNVNPSGQDTICGGPPGVMSDGRTSMTVGIKIEGPGADRNLIEGNRVVRAGMAGIAVVGHLARAPQNTDNAIRNNRVFETAVAIGGDPEKLGRHSFGIASIRSSGAASAVGTLIEGNNSSRNYGDGIYLDSRGTLSGAVVRNNVVNNNGLDGIDIEGPGDPDGPPNVLTGNRGHNNGHNVEEVNGTYRIAGHGGVDGFDRSDGCQGNDWSGNRFATVNQECVANGGTGRVGGPGRSGNPGGYGQPSGPDDRALTGLHAPPG